MTAIGETLRRERLRQNLDLRQISRELKISPQFLEAIEAEQFGKLPGAVFAKSFVRQYARLLGLDDAEMAAEVARLIEPPAEAAPAQGKMLPSVSGIEPGAIHSWERVGDGNPGGASWLLRGTVLVAITVSCAGLYSLWERTRRQPTPQAPVASTPPIQAPPSPQPGAIPPAEQPSQQPPAPSDQPAGGPAAEASAGVTAPAPSQPPAAAPTPTQSSVSKPGSASPPAESPAPQPVQSSTTLTPTPANPNASIHAQLTAQEPVWVRVRNNGKYLFSGTLAANQTRTVDADGDVEVLVGNAASLEIQLNGKPLGALGPKGQVRTVQLTSGGFKIVPPSKPAPAAPFPPL